jgi:hypothetical protein
MPAPAQTHYDDRLLATADTDLADPVVTVRFADWTPDGGYSALTDAVFGQPHPLGPTGDDQYVDEQALVEQLQSRLSVTLGRGTLDYRNGRWRATVTLDDTVPVHSEERHG